MNLEPQEVVDAHPPDPVGNRQGNHDGETEDKDVRQYLGSGNFKFIWLGYSSWGETCHHCCPRLQNNPEWFVYCPGHRGSQCFLIPRINIAGIVNAALPTCPGKSSYVCPVSVISFHCENDKFVLWWSTWMEYGCKITKDVEGFAQASRGLPGLT